MLRHLKILVIGPQGAGKTSLIQRVAKGAISTDVDGTTVGLDFGILQSQDLTVYLFGTPGMKRFNLVRKVLSEGTDGVVLVVDSTDIRSIREAIDYLTEIFGRDPPPVVVAANKQDEAGAIPAREVQRILSLPARVYPVSARRGDGLQQLLESFISDLLRAGKGRVMPCASHA